jgi:hypothetical protein
MENTNDKQTVVISQLEHAAKQVEFLRTIVSALVALLIVAFVGGKIWADLQRYEERVDNQNKSIADLKMSAQSLLKDEEKVRNQDKTIGSIIDDVRDVKKNLGDLGLNGLVSDKEVSSDSDTVCEPGAVVVGIARKGNGMSIRCSSVGRAVWNRASSTPAVANADVRETAGH